MSSGTLYIRDSRTDAEYEIPIRRNAISAVDFKRIKAPEIGVNRADQIPGGLRVHDPGLVNTTVVESAISFSDHERGLLLFRGYSLEELWTSDFEEMLHLLVWGSYPAPPQREQLRSKLAAQMLAVPDIVQTAVQSLPNTTPPLALMLTGLSTYLSCIPESIPASTNAHQYRANRENVDNAVLRTVAAYAVVFGIVASHRKSIPFTPPSQDRTYCENLFTMAGLVDPVAGTPDPVKLSCFRRFAMLNADHGMALTVFSALVTASSLTDPVSCVITSVASAWGPLHFGATESAQRALTDIGTEAGIPAFLDEVKQGRKRLFGYGHRSYKGIDPRVRFIQSILQDLPSTRLLKLAEAIERAASGDDYFRSRGLYPNADFYGNFVFTGIGFEVEMIPAAMLAQRIMGIMAHWREYMHTPYTPLQKRLIILTASVASTFSPLSSNIYYPALNALATDLHVTPSQINLTITTYMICQALSPTLTATLSDTSGRKPAYAVCFTIYIASNILLSQCTSYTSLSILRAAQSTGISGTVALSAAVAADIIDPHERGVYMGLTSLGNIIAPSLGPVLGGMITGHYGWRAVFGFLAGTRLAFPNPLTPLRLMTHLPTGLVLLSNGLVFASYYAVTAGIPFQFKRIYGLSDMGVGLVFIPAGVGSLVSAAFNGNVVDWNYRRVKVGYEDAKGNANGNGEGNRGRDGTKRDQEFPVEQARLQIGGPMTLLCALMIFIYGLVLDQHPPLALSLAMIFLVSFSITASYNVMNVLLVDLYYSTPATVMATNNFVRCFLGAASTAFVTPMIERFGNGRTYGMVAALIVGVCCPVLGTIDPLPSGLPILELQYPGTSWVLPGDTLAMSDTHPLPQISTWGLNPNSTYLVLFVDLDVQYGEMSTVILHWYQANMVIHHAKPWLEPGEPGKGPYGKHPAEYIAPQPPPNTHHRYVYLAFEQHEQYTFPDCFGHIFPKTMEARAGFDLHQFVEVTGLQRPAAGNYFFVNNDHAVTGTSSTPAPTPTTTWVRSAPCSQPVIATATTPVDAREHVRGAQRRQIVM
ncbi:citrate synthase-like protein [Aspergillus desertorum]